MSFEVLDNEEAERRGAQNLRERTELTKRATKMLDILVESVSDKKRTEENPLSFYYAIN